MKESLKSIFGWMKPKYNELTTYLAALTCLILLFAHADFRQTYADILSGGGAYEGAFMTFVIFGLMATLGFFLSVFHIFTERKKSYFEKTCMGIFVMGANGLAGIFAGMEMLPLRWSLLALFPVWNILMGIILLYQIGLEKFDVTDENVSLWEVLIASLTLLIVFAVVEFGFHLSWALTFSICMFFSSTIIFFINWLIDYFDLRTFGKQGFKRW